MIEEIKVGQKEILFARHNGKLIYPKYASTENLVLHYDFSGRTNLDVQKGIAEDLSGNGNSGVLQNFSYIDGSGYLDNALIFDGIDDFITIPESQIDLDNFTYSEGINVLSFRGDEVATVVDGVVEIGGRNLIKRNLIFRSLGSSSHSYVQFENKYSLKVQAGAARSGVFSYSINDQVYIEILTGDIISYGFKVYFETSGTLEYGYQNSTIRFIDIPAKVWVDLKVEGEKDINDNRNIRFYSKDNAVFYISELKIEKGTKATDWTPAPENLETTTFKPLFDKKIKSALYWNRALTDEELLQVYNIQIKRA